MGTALVSTLHELSRAHPVLVAIDDVQWLDTPSAGALEFAAKLRTQLPCVVETWDERLTTVAAERALREAGKKTRDTRHVVDQVAAQMILQGYLDRERNVAAP